MTNGSSRQYSAVFLLHAKLAANFRGVMAMAQSRLQRLQAAAAKVGAGFRRMALSFAGIGGILAGFGITKVFESIFGEAGQAAAALDTKTRRLTEALMTNQKIRALGRGVAEQQVKRIYQANEELSKQGVISKEVLDTAASMLALQKLSPRRIVDTLGPLSDMLVSTKGVRAAQEMLPEAAFAFGKAVRTGMTRPLQQFGITLSKPEQKLLQHKAKIGDLEGAYKFLMERVKLFAGSNRRALDTPLGQIQAMHNAMGQLSEDIGVEILPVQAEMAAAWTKALPQTKPAIIGTLKALGRTARWASKQVEDLFARLNPPQEEKPGLQLFTQYQDMIGSFNAVKGQKDQTPSFDATSDLMNQWTRSGTSQMISTLAKLGDAIAGLGPQFEVSKQQATSWGDWLAGVVDDLQLSTAKMLQQDAKDIAALGEAWKKFKKDASISILVDDWDRLLKTIKPTWDWLKVNLTNEKLQKLFGPIGDALLNNLLGPIRDIKKAWDELAKAWQERPEWLGGVKLPSTSGLPPPQAGPPISMPPSAAASKIPAAPKSALPPPQAGPPIPMPQTAVSLSKIQGAATGGIIRGHSLLQVAERGPEAIIPLSGGPRAEGLLHYASRAMGMGGTTNNNREQHITFAPQITIQGGDGGSGQEQKIEAQLRKLLYAEFIPAIKAATAQERRTSFQSGYS